MKPLIKPTEGYILTIPHIRKLLGARLKEPSGEDQMSKVLVVGADVKDEQGTVRTTPVKEGDIIIHRESNKDFTFENQLYRFVHFTEVHGIYESTKS